ncbi:hypothetical protein HYPSUDRAFT_987574 [Hypholoma sublateritium FD-334 SS-4]|uniref:Uncharacterized protein n=1 Tax=Hypholoma sublateritium (strain FD-334 SS-4) TaxID=945553 RepID=A0A0D2LHM4_HYPSF|nr:hypothetical protein HYPSUDRAFT_987574 [Hypholoma sublateritium FD-334 SS-4]
MMISVTPCFPSSIYGSQRSDNYPSTVQKQRGRDRLRSHYATRLAHATPPRSASIPMVNPEKQKAKAPEIIDARGDPELSDNASDSDDGHTEADAAEGAAVPSSSTSAKKKKKKKSKAKKLLDGIINSKDGIPEEVVGTVLDKVKAEGGSAALEANAENVREALRQMKIMDVVRGKAGVGGLNKKDMGEHKVVLVAIFYVRDG